MAKRFTRRIEDFICAHCGERTSGSGYTNHCPRCLWSKHVDVNPGDRAEACGGMMEPVGVEFAGKEYRILHRCTKCNLRRINTAAPDDNFDAIVQLSKRKTAPD